MTVRRFALVAGVFSAATVAPALAGDRTLAAEGVARTAMNAASPLAPPAETIAIAVLDGRETVWSGSLRIGGPYGSANFSQSKSEYALQCDAAPVSGRYANSSESLSLGISRNNWQQEPDRFSVNLNWTTPVPSCEGEGNDSFGFNRVVTVARGESATIEGSGGRSVRLTRPR